MYRFMIDDGDGDSPSDEEQARIEPSAHPAPLPDLATRIREAQRQAREGRVKQGLPPEPDDGGYTPRARKKHAPKRSKNHGQFLGTACDSWEATRRKP